MNLAYNHSMNWIMISAGVCCLLAALAVGASWYSKRRLYYLIDNIDRMSHAEVDAYIAKHCR